MDGNAEHNNVHDIFRVVEDTHEPRQALAGVMRNLEGIPFVRRITGERRIIEVIRGLSFLEIT